MTRKAKALRVLALMTAMSGASVLLLSVGSTSAKASEERLHSEQLSTYGLVPPTSFGKTSAEGGDSVTSGSISVASNIKTTSSRNRNNEPQLEDPGLPTYDGPDASPSNARSAAR